MSDSTLSYHDLLLLCNRQAELLKHVRDVIMAFNPNHYFIEQEKLLTKGQDSLWSEVMGLRKLRDEHESSLEKKDRDISKLTAQLSKLGAKIE